MDSLSWAEGSTADHASYIRKRCRPGGDQRSTKGRTYLFWSSTHWNPSRYWWKNARFTVFGKVRFPVFYFLSFDTDTDLFFLPAWQGRYTCILRYPRAILDAGARPLDQHLGRNHNMASPSTTIIRDRSFPLSSTPLGIIWTGLSARSWRTQHDPNAAELDVAKAILLSN
jgi:hypothetical protein